ncbi:nucleoside triphosphate pyrophosphohydrolase [Shewanella surugensis]|uniref:Nucleoside triphosphate pyrophosphohydrolase n=1 Tax=Shewanella surugensis TaxID=212020 RepID=A0ABT0L8L6_9GAMM|nr:nucleoside triphosphate pyrophosphohydrolase [Shewanella surugensis]MCL1123980.1 nucleoside triphosphate pyrophosphohydrolase [Shewanella surugensis]
MNNEHNIQPLLDIMAKLRDPETGCSWDLAQQFDTIVPFTIEEAYEVADTIERMALDELPNELGDLLFQVVFYCQLGKEQGLFDFGVVVNKICDKLIHRHPHVFGDKEIQSSAEIKQSWESLKAKERAQRQLHSAVDDIPLTLPALTRSVKIQKRVAQVGFDWDTLAPVVAKVHEEIEEVLDEVNQSIIEQEKVADEMGDLLFAVVNMARHLKVDPEQALRQANRKFERRFRGVEAKVVASGSLMTEQTLSELDAYWDAVKQEEKV